MITELLVEADVAAIVYPKKIEKGRVQKEIDEILGAQEAREGYQPYTAQEVLARAHLARYVMRIRRQQIDARMDEIREMRQVTGSPPLTAQEIRMQRETIREKLIDAVALGFAGIDKYAPTEKELDDRQRMIRSRFKSPAAYTRWISDYFGGADHFHRWMRYEIAADYPEGSG